MSIISRACVRLSVLSAIIGIDDPSFAVDGVPAKPGETIEIGVPEGLFQGIPEVYRSGAGDSLLRIMKDNTGIRGNVHMLPNAMLLAEQIDAGKIHLGLFQGHEFAWAKAKFPDLIPIVVAVPFQPNQSFCLVCWDCRAKNIGDLTKSKISYPPIRRDFCELFLAHQRETHMRGAEFAGQLDAASATDAIFDVIDGKSGCTVVDSVALKFFETVYPGPYKNLRILSQSEVFPNACIAVKKNKLDERTVDKFRNSLLNVQDLPGGKPLLATWKLKRFSKVPEDYERSLRRIQKEYPLPPVTAATIPN